MDGTYGWCCGFQRGSLNIGVNQKIISKLVNRVFSHDVTAAILVYQNNETAAMLVYQTNPVGVELCMAAGHVSENALLTIL